MRVIKGFVEIQGLLDNSPGNNSILGELSQWSLTYTRERGEFENPAYPGYILSVFKSEDNVTKLPLTAPDFLVNAAIEMTAKVKSHMIGMQGAISRSDFDDWVSAAFYNRIINLEFGLFISNGNGLSLPEWISFESLDDPDSGYVKIWLCDASFKDQYDEYDVIVIPPIDNLDDFFTSETNVQTLINSITVPQMVDKIQNAKGDIPETYIRTIGAKYVGQLTPNFRVDTNWTVLINGSYADNIDTIKDEITKYVLANSTHTREQWIAILPDLFKRTEFLLLPRWDKYSIPNLTVTSGLYSVMIEPYESIEFAVSKATFYPADWVRQNITLFTNDYKTLAIVGVNGPDNIPEKARLTTIFPDYAPLPTTDQDFNRMSVFTKDWILIMEDMLRIAETMTTYSNIPRTMRRIIRNNELFLSVIYDNVQYLVSAKINYGI